MGRAEPLLWGLGGLLLVLVLLLGLALSARALRELSRTGRPVQRQDEATVAQDYQAAADELRALIAEGYRPNDETSRRS